jgi:hypothetical protein
MPNIKLILLGVLCFAGLCLVVFGWWGTYTIEGQHAYDEMAGIVPFLGLYGGGFLVIASIAGIWYLNRN